MSSRNTFLLDPECLQIDTLSPLTGDVWPQVRTTLKHIQEHPFPAITIFPDGRPHYFRKDELSGQWVQIRY